MKELDCAMFENTLIIIQMKVELRRFKSGK